MLFCEPKAHMGLPCKNFFFR